MNNTQRRFLEATSTKSGASTSIASSTSLSDSWKSVYPSLSDSTIQFVSTSLAPTTIATRARIKRFLEGKEGANEVIEAIGRLSVSPSTKLQYVKAAEAFNPRLRNDPIIRLFKRALAKASAATPLKQAVPISPYQLSTIVRNAHWRTALAALLAYKSASRWTETCSLTVDNFLEVSPTSVSINWRNLPKAAHVDPFRPDMFSVVQGNFTELIHEYILRLKPGEKICTVTTTEMNRLLAVLLGKGYTTHSLKRGSVTVAMSHVAQGTIEVQDVSRLAKHLNVATTIRYAANDLATAKAMGTQRVTQLL